MASDILPFSFPLGTERLVLDGGWSDRIKQMAEDMFAWDAEERHRFAESLGHDLNNGIADKDERHVHNLLLQAVSEVEAHLAARAVVSRLGDAPRTAAV